MRLLQIAILAAMLFAVAATVVLAIVYFAATTVVGM
jgi:hypothetical protein